MNINCYQVSSNQYNRCCLFIRRLKRCRIIRYCSRVCTHTYRYAHMDFLSGKHYMLKDMNYQLEKNIGSQFSSCVSVFLAVGLKSKQPTVMIQWMANYGFPGKQTDLLGCHSCNSRQGSVARLSVCMALPTCTLRALEEWQKLPN